MIQRWRLGAFLTLVALSVWRAPILFTAPRFWAEEAEVFFTYAWTARLHGHWLAGFINGPAALAIGYFTLWPNAASTIAAAVPLEWAPLVTTVAAASVQWAVVAWVLWGPVELWRAPVVRAAAAIVVVVAAPSAEVWLNTINSQSYFALLTLLILCSETTAGLCTRVVGRVALGCAALTGSLSCLLTPAFAIRAVRDRDRERAIQTAILATGGFLQAGVLLAAHASGSSLVAERLSSVPWASVASVVATRSLGFTLTGLHGAEALVPTIVAAWQAGGSTLAHVGWALLALELAALAFVTWGLPVRIRLGLAVLYCGLVVSAVVGGVGGVDADKFRLVFPGSNERYFFVPNAVVLLSLLAALGNAGTGRRDVVRRAVQAAALVTALAFAWGDFANDHLVNADWPRWRTEVAAWRADPHHRLAVWPAGWSIELPAPAPISRSGIWGDTPAAGRELQRRPIGDQGQNGTGLRWSRTVISLASGTRPCNAPSTRLEAMPRTGARAAGRP